MLEWHYYDKASCISSASACWPQSSNSSISVCQEHGLTPFPSNQCWNMAWQHASGSLRYLMSMLASFAPVGSKSKRIPRFFQHDETRLIMQIFPLGVLQTDSLASVGVTSIVAQRWRSEHLLNIIIEIYAYLLPYWVQCTYLQYHLHL